MPQTLGRSNEIIQGEKKSILLYKQENRAEQTQKKTLQKMAGNHINVFLYGIINVVRKVLH